MLPFVRGADDLTALRDALSAAGAEGTRVFAKLENREGLAMLPELLPHADHIVIARGDLGNDLPLWELPAAAEIRGGNLPRGGKTVHGGHPAAPFDAPQRGAHPRRGV